MTSFDSPLWRYFTLTFALASLAACGGPQSQPAMPAVNASKVARAQRTHAWMAPGTSGRNLLYVSDNGLGSVFVYTYYPGPITFAGLLVGASHPQGECVDKNQNVWVADAVLLEYAHGQSEPIATLGDPQGGLSACAVDPVTGNLAAISSQVAYPSVAIYKRAAGKPKIYVFSNFEELDACTYDAGGNLFVVGASRSGNGFQLAQLRHGGRRFGIVTLNQAISSAGGIQWDGQHLVIGDSTNDELYQFDISGNTGTVVGSTPINGSYYMRQFFIQNNRVIVPSPQSLKGGFVNLYEYPKGGFRTRTLWNFSVPIGAAVSLATNPASVR